MLYACRPLVSLTIHVLDYDVTLVRSLTRRRRARTGSKELFEQGLVSPCLTLFSSQEANEIKFYLRQSRHTPLIQGPNDLPFTIKIGWVLLSDPPVQLTRPDLLYTATSIDILLSSAFSTFPVTSFTSMLYLPPSPFAYRNR